MTIQKHDFIEVSYTAKTAEGMVFDTTDETIAKEHGIYGQQKTYGSLTLCVGEYQVVQGLDESFIGKTEDTTYTVTVEPEKAFGKKRAEKIKLVPLKKFTEQGITPQQGLQVYVDNQMAVIKTVSGGRCLVDFNHPLSGKSIIYDVAIKQKVTDEEKQLTSLITLQFPNSSIKVDKEKNAQITLPQKLPEQYTQIIEKQIKKLIPTIQKITFLEKQQTA